MGIDMWGADIKNGNLSAPISENFCVTCGNEFGLQDKGKRGVMNHALCGAKFSGYDFWNHLRECIEHLGYEFCQTDPYLWMWIAYLRRGEDYEYMLQYVDDYLIGSKLPEESLKKFGIFFMLETNLLDHHAYTWELGYLKWNYQMV